MPTPESIRRKYKIKFEKRQEQREKGKSIKDKKLSHKLSRYFH